MDEERQGTVEAPPDAELVHFKESFETFNKIINNLQRQYLSLEKEYARQETRLEEINHQLRRTIAANRGTTVFLNSILTSLSSGVVAVNREGVVSHFNPAAERITGISAARALGRRYDEVISAKRGGRFSALDTVLSGGEFESEEKVIINNKGEDIPVSVSTALLHDPEEGPLGAVEIFFDLTKIKRLEEEILRIKTLAALGEMAATVAHEVRNPLGGIGGFAALLKRELADDADKVRLVDKIIAGVNTLNLTVTALLDYTRREQLNLRTIPLARLIEESVDYERADQGAAAVNVEIAVDIADCDLPVTCDPHLMRQALLNLLRNSREAMPEGGRITVRAGATAAGVSSGGAVFIEVADTGHGIAPDIRDKIFQPFFSTRHKHNGSGLGLATVWKTVQAHGGEITVSSDVDKGAVFRIILPGDGDNEVGAV
jgi:PAS domain S-box-containing protein